MPAALPLRTRAGRCGSALSVLMVLWTSVLSDATAAQELGPGEAVVVGRVTEATTGQPVAGAVVRIEDVDRFALTDSLGRYSLPRVPPGTHTLVAEGLGFATVRVPVLVGVRGVVVRDIVLARSALSVPGITVTADVSGRARGETGTATVIGREAIVNQTAASLAGILELVPGVVVGPPGLDAVQQIPLRTAPTTSAPASEGAGTADLAAFGTLIVLDGVPLSNNANLQTTGTRGETRAVSSAGGGVDLRRIPASMLERVEVIRGIPSARYGDLTQGVIVVDTRAGAVEPMLSMRYDARTAGLSLLGGRSLTPARTVSVSTDVTATRRAPGLSDDLSYRMNVQLAHRSIWPGHSQRAELVAPRFTLDTRLNAFRVFDDRPEDPDLLPGAVSWSRDTGLRVSVRARLRATGERWLEATGSLDRNRQNSFVQASRIRPALPFTDRLDEGRAIGRFIGGPYLSRVWLDGVPWLVYGRLEAGATRRWLAGEHHLRAGGELRREWNHGDGYRFEIEFPPQVRFNGVQGFDRPRPYDSIPALATTGLYIDDRVLWRFGSSGVLEIQAGARADVLLEARSSPRDVVLQPRTNIELAPVANLRLRAGWGRTAKLPPLGMLYPAAQYFDVVNVNWYTNDPAERLAVLTTFIRDPTNRELGYSVGTKAEAGADALFAGGRSRVSLVAFRDRIDGAVGVRPVPAFLLREHFALADSTRGTGRPPEIIEPAEFADTVPILIDRPANHRRLLGSGVELTATFPEVPWLRTRFEVQAARITSELRTEALQFAGFDDFQMDGRRPRTPFWQGAVRHGTRTLATYRAVHQQPELGLVVTATVQHSFRESRRDIGGTDTLAFAGYLTRDARLVPVPANQRGLPEFGDLRVPRTGVLTEPRSAPADWLLSLQVSKTLAGHGRLSFYAFNALDREGRFAAAGVSARPYPAMRYGLELLLPPAALAGLR
jgi:hypothetical protein